MKPNPHLPRAAFLAGALAFSAFGPGASARAETFIVDSASDFKDDVADRVCFSSRANGCTLRAAIEEANARPGRDQIHFSIGRPGARATISPVRALPEITEAVIIDGWTQGGEGYQGPPLIELEGSATSSTSGFHISSGSTVLRGLIVRDFGWAGIELVGGGKNVVQNCYIGTDATGTRSQLNHIGIRIDESPNNTLGGSRPELRNLVSGNYYGIFMQGKASTGNSILGNFIGTDVNGTTALENAYGIFLAAGPSRNSIGSGEPGGRNLISGNLNGVLLALACDDNSILGNYIGTDIHGSGDLHNTSSGIFLTSSAGNRIGTVLPGTGNTIAFNEAFGGITIVEAEDGPASTGNSVRGNAIFRNRDLGIFLGTTTFEVTPNDPLDADTGPNNLQNYPELEEAWSSEGGTVVQGILRSLPGASFAIDLYSSSECDASGHGEGERYLQSIALATNEDGNAFFQVEMDELVPLGRFITATAVHQDTLDTSEFSRCREVVEAPAAERGKVFVVNESDDLPDTSVGDGVCSAKPGVCTLRAAIEEANFRPGRDQIRFQIGASPAVKTLRPAAPWPAIVDAVVIEGWTQGGEGYRGPPLIEIDGASLSEGSSGIEVGGSGSAVLQGLVIRDCDTGIRLGGGGNSVVQGCFVGTDATGTEDQGNDTGILIASPGNTIGGTRVEHRNLISGNESGVFVTDTASTGNSILGNFIGTDVTGRSRLPNGYGIFTAFGASRNVIGSGLPAGRNVVSGNTEVGINLAQGASANLVRGNYIGTDVDGDAALPNGTGIRIVASADNRIGAIRPDEGNRIAFNREGVLIFDNAIPGSANQNSIRGNAIYSNADLGIGLDNTMAARPNDPLDADAGSNNWQNHPEILGAESSEDATLVEGALDSLPDTGFFIDLYWSGDCDASGHGEGEHYLESLAVMTDAGGHASFQITLGEVVPAGRFLTATAVHQETFDTSEFSRCFQVAATAIEVETPFRRGDATDDAGFNITDPIAILGHLFLGDPATLACERAADANDDGNVNITDPVAILNHLFLGAPPPPEPFAACGVDTTADVLACESFTSCP
jgi:CSLREA domain-containing protein